MSARFLFVALVVVLLVDVARAQGTYQPVRNGKTLVWNDNPKPGDEVTWSGGRDRDGYARGFGTLTWYTKEEGSDKSQLYALYWGNMVHGKLSGPVNVHSKKKTHYAIFADGTRVTRWSPGTAPSRMTQEQMTMIAEHKASSVPETEPESPAAGPVEKHTAAAIAKSEPLTPAPVEKRNAATISETEPEPPAAGPVEKHSAPAIPETEPKPPAAGPVAKHTTPAVPESEPEPPAAGPLAERPEDTGLGPESNESIQDLGSESWFKVGIDDSLRILVFPPRSLKRYAKRSDQ